jgi:class 3 adenylate cyclase/tetratricopeptide (TPR) repeat protein
VTGIQEWLKALGFEKYIGVFAEHEITFEILPDLTESDIDRLNLPTGPRRKILVAIQKLRDAALAQSSSRRPDLGVARDAERRQLTVMFCDLVGSTSLAGRLDPEELRALVHAFRKTCQDAVARYDGYVAQYQGDGLMAYFGWPIAHEDDAERSLRAALEIVHAVGQVKATPPLAVRIGVATGTVVVGEIIPGDPAEGRLAVGETPNLAQRLQGLAEPDAIVIAPATRSLVGGAFELVDMGSHRLKGVAEPVRAWRVHAVAKPRGRFEAVRGAMTLTPLVGRHEECSMLLHCWRRACDGTGQVVSISGEPGIGKSRLTRALREQIGAERYTMLRYQCSPYHINSSLYPISEQIEFVAGFVRDDNAEQKLDKLEAILAGTPRQRVAAAPLLAAMLSLPVDRYPALDLSPLKRKEKTLEALADQVEALSERTPVLLLFEDAHWIDNTSQKALEVLISRVQRLRILVVVTFRPEFVPPWSSLPSATLVSLDRLGPSEGAELATHVARGKGLPAAVMDQIVARTDGVPLFVEELTKSVLESGFLAEADVRGATQLTVPGSSIPVSLRDSLLARLDRLSPVKSVIQIGACIGREFSQGLLARIPALRGEQIDQALQRLTEAGLVYRRGTASDDIYVFKHALVQDAAYESLLKTKRQELHAQLAQVLEHEFADRIANEPELLAHHHTLAGNTVAAIRWWHEAGKLAARKEALQEAVGHFRAALSLIEQLPPSAERDGLELSIREPLNGALIGWRGWPASDVDTNATAILELAKKQGTPESLLMGLYGVWINTLTQGRVADSLGWAERLLAEGDRAGDLDLRVLGHTAAMISHFYLGQLLEAREYGDRGNALYDPQRADRWIQLTGHDTRTVYLGWSAHWTWMMGYPDRAVQISNEKDAHARRLGHALDLGYALTVGAYPFDYRCEPEQLVERVREADVLAREQGIRTLYEVMVPQVEGLARLRSRHLSEAVLLLRQGIENWNKLCGHTRVPYLKSALAEAFALQGDLDAALETIDESLSQIERPGWQERSHFAEVLRLKGWMLMKQGRDEEAEPVLNAAIDWARRQHAKSWELRAATTLTQLLVERGRYDAARDLLAPIYNWFTEGFDTHDLTAARALLESLQ